MKVRTDLMWRIYLAYFGVCLVGIAVIFQSFHIQVVQGEYYRAMADSLTTTYRTIEAERGNVFSEDGSLLATSLPFFEVRVDLNAPGIKDDIFDEKIDSLALLMSQFFSDRTKSEYKRWLINARNSGNRYLLISRNATYPELQEMKSWPLFNLGRYKGGFIALQKNRRVTPFKMLAHRTIGYVREGVQPVGLEGQFDEYLSGVQGKRLMQKISGDAWVPINDDNEISPQNGMDIITTIDVNLQDVAESALFDALVKHNADHGSVIVMEVKTGKIKAIANLGKTGENEYWEKYNYAIGEATEPGSTMKVAAIMALLEDGYIDIYDSVNLEGGQMQFFDKTMRDSEKHDQYMVSIQRAFEISSNVGISRLIQHYYAHAPEAFVKHLQNMGLSEETGIEIKGEAKPYIKDPKGRDWSGITLPWMSVGYEVMLTPLQILSFYNAIANDGKVMKPYLVQEIQEYGSTIKEFEPEVVKKQICSDKTLQKVKLLLEGVVDSGTAVNIKTPNYKIAGKTGTAQIADDKRGYRKVYQASFVGYFPAEDPLYSCIVVVNEPRNGIFYGGWVAGPVFREIADKVVANNVNLHLAVNGKQSFYREKVPQAKPGYATDLTNLYNTLGISFSSDHDAEWVYCRKLDHSIIIKEKVVQKGLVPDVKGMSLKDAMFLLENKGLKVRHSGRGKVRKQSIPAGTRYYKGTEIKIDLG